MKTYGGQAVIEGVMMRSQHFMTTAVYTPTGKKVKRQRLPKQTIANKIPFLRGMVNLVDMMKDGMSVLTWSAEQQLEEDEQGGKAILFITTIFSLLIAITIFKGLPLLAAKLVGSSNPFIFNLIDGAVKLSLFIGYIYAISFSKDIRRVFQFHAAEHKAIACHEAQKPLTVEHARPFRNEHKRCGTNFLFIVIFISMIVYLFIPLSFGFFTNLLLRLLLLPVIAGISYEILKFNAKHETFITKMIIYPGLLMQKLTTKDPDDEQLEMGLLSLRELLRLEESL